VSVAWVGATHRSSLIRHSGEVLFNKVLNNFSLAAALSNMAIPALVGASQPDKKGGSASFESIHVVTAVASAVS
jgi:hypothetical protein